MSNIILSGMVRVQNFIAALKKERGQDLIEYAVLAGAIGIALFAVLIATPGLGTAFGEFKTAIANCVSFNTTCP